MRKVGCRILLAIAVPFTPWIVLALYAASYINGFLLRSPWIYRIAMRRHNARLDQQRLAAVERARHTSEPDAESV